MVFWRQLYHLRSIVVKKTFEKLVILTVLTNDLVEITYANVHCLNIYPWGRVKEGSWKGTIFHTTEEYLH